MNLLQHTTYDEVRSLLGVTKRDLPDDTVALPHWILEVEQQVRDIDNGAGAVLTQFDTIYALAEGSRTAAQTQFLKVLNMYVLYVMGYQLVSRADVFQPETISDGKATVSRHADRFAKLCPVIEGGMERLKERVKDALRVLVPAATIVPAVTRTMIIGSALGTDPVTGT